MNSKFRETIAIASKAIQEEFAKVRNVRHRVVQEGERFYMVTEKATETPSFRPPTNSSVPPPSGRVHRLIGKRRAIRYLMMFACSLTGGFLGTLLCHWYLK